MRAFQDLYSGGIRTELFEAPVCPYCNSKMELHDGNYVNSKYKNQMRYVCTNYPKCDTSARAQKMKNGNWYLVSTPADKKLRKLRNEAHFWMSKMVETGVFSGEQEVAFYVSNKSMLCNGRRIHIGQCRDAACIDIIKICIEALYEHKGSFPKFENFIGSYAKQDKELWIKVVEMTYPAKVKPQN